MTSEPQPIDILETILKRNREPNTAINLRENEAGHYFYFDKITNPDDLEAAWAIFRNSGKIRQRLAEVEAVSYIIDGWGYRVSNDDNRCTPDELVALVQSHLEQMRLLIPHEDYYQPVIDFINGGFEVQSAPPDVTIPSEYDRNMLVDILNGVIGEFLIDHFIEDSEPHEELLYNWAIYLTKCDEIAAYLLWPCLHNVDHLPEETFFPAFQLWHYNCRRQYWIKDDDFGSRMVYASLPNES